MQIIAYFEYMGAYLVRAVNGEHYLWENQQDLLYKLGHSQEEIQMKLRQETDWSEVEAIDPHGIREAGKRQEESQANWRKYFLSLRRQYQNN